MKDYALEPNKANKIVKELDFSGRIIGIERAVYFLHLLALTRPIRCRSITRFGKKDNPVSTLSGFEIMFCKDALDLFEKAE